jgi:hypothetical protein
MLKISYTNFHNLVASRYFCIRGVSYYTRTKQRTISLNHNGPLNFVMDRDCVLCEGGT